MKRIALLLIIACGAGAQTFAPYVVDGLSHTTFSSSTEPFAPVQSSGTNFIVGQPTDVTRVYSSVAGQGFNRVWVSEDEAHDPFDIVDAVVAVGTDHYTLGFTTSDLSAHYLIDFNFGTKTFGDAYAFTEDWGTTGAGEPAHIGSIRVLSNGDIVVLYVTAAPILRVVVYSGGDWGSPATVSSAPAGVSSWVAVQDTSDGVNMVYNDTGHSGRAYYRRLLAGSLGTETRIDTAISDNVVALGYGTVLGTNLYIPYTNSVGGQPSVMITPFASASFTKQVIGGITDGAWSMTIANVSSVLTFWYVGSTGVNVKDAVYQSVFDGTSTWTTPAQTFPPHTQTVSGQSLTGSLGMLGVSADDTGVLAIKLYAADYVTAPLIYTITTTPTSTVHAYPVDPGTSAAWTTPDAKSFAPKLIGAAYYTWGVGTDHVHVYKSLNQGITWSALDDSHAPSKATTQLNLASEFYNPEQPSGFNRIYGPVAGTGTNVYQWGTSSFDGNTHMFKSTNSGTTWEEEDQFNAPTALDICAAGGHGVLCIQTDTGTSPYTRTIVQFNTTTDLWEASGPTTTAMGSDGPVLAIAYEPSSLQMVFAFPTNASGAWSLNIYTYDFFNATWRGSPQAINSAQTFSGSNEMDFSMVADAGNAVTFVYHDPTLGWMYSRRALTPLGSAVTLQTETDVSTVLVLSSGFLGAGAATTGGQIYVPYVTSANTVGVLAAAYATPSWAITTIDSTGLARQPNIAVVSSVPTYRYTRMDPTLMHGPTTIYQSTFTTTWSGPILYYDESTDIGISPTTDMTGISVTPVGTTVKLPVDSADQIFVMSTPSIICAAGWYTTAALTLGCYSTTNFFLIDFSFNTDTYGSPYAQTNAFDMDGTYFSLRILDNGNKVLTYRDINNGLRTFTFDGTSWGTVATISKITQVTLVPYTLNQALPNLAPYANASAQPGAPFKVGSNYYSLNVTTATDNLFHVYKSADLKTWVEQNAAGVPPLGTVQGVASNWNGGKVSILVWTGSATAIYTFDTASDLWSSAVIDTGSSFHGVVSATRLAGGDIVAAIQDVTSNFLTYSIHHSTTWSAPASIKAVAFTVVRAALLDASDGVTFIYGLDGSGGTAATTYTRYLLAGTLSGETDLGTLFSTSHLPDHGWGQGASIGVNNYFPFHNFNNNDTNILMEATFGTTPVWTITTVQSFLSTGLSAYDAAMSVSTLDGTTPWFMWAAGSISATVTKVYESLYQNGAWTTPLLDLDTQTDPPLATKPSGTYFFGSLLTTKDGIVACISTGTPGCSFALQMTRTQVSNPLDVQRAVSVLNSDGSITYVYSEAHITNPVWSNGYKYRITVTVDNTQIGGTDLLNYPLLVRGTLTDLKQNVSGGQVQSASGYDIIFTSDQAGTSRLNWEQESWNASTGAFAYWVNVPFVDSSTPTKIYLFIDKQGVTSFQGGVSQATWRGTTAQLVYHLSDNAANTTVLDSTLNANANLMRVDCSTSNCASGGPNTSARTGTGLIGLAQSCNGSHDAVRTPFSTTQPTVGSSTGFAMSGWFKLVGSLPPSNKGYMWSYDVSGGTLSDFTVAQKVEFITAGSGGATVLSSAFTPGTTNWHYWVVSYDTVAGTMKEYIDNSLVASNSGMTYSGNYGASHYMFLCNSDTDGGALSAFVDEDRVYSAPRSAATITADYNNQVAGSTMVTFGSKALNTATLEGTYSRTLSPSGILGDQVVVSNQIFSDPAPELLSTGTVFQGSIYIPFFSSFNGWFAVMKGTPANNPTTWTAQFVSQISSQNGGIADATVVGPLLELRWRASFGAYFANAAMLATSTDGTFAPSSTFYYDSLSLPPIATPPTDGAFIIGGVSGSEQGTMILMPLGTNPNAAFFSQLTLPPTILCNITGSFKFPNGTSFNGRVSVQLVRPTVTLGCSPPFVVTTYKQIQSKIVNGTMTPINLYPSSCIKPPQPYIVYVYDSTGRILYKGQWTVPYTSSADASTLN